MDCVPSSAGHPHALLAEAARDLWPDRGLDYGAGEVAVGRAGGPVDGVAAAVSPTEGGVGQAADTRGTGGLGSTVFGGRARVAECSRGRSRSSHSNGGVSD